jgi:hypothetical protein
MSSAEKKTPYIAETFTAKGAEGVRHTVRLWNWRHEITMLDGRTETLTSGWKYETAKGQHLNPAGEGRFEIVVTGEIITRE